MLHERAYIPITLGVAPVAPAASPQGGLLVHRGLRSHLVERDRSHVSAKSAIVTVGHYERVKYCYFAVYAIPVADYGILFTRSNRCSVITKLLSSARRTVFKPSRSNKV
jgi:hypothetical protein